MTVAGKCIKIIIPSQLKHFSDDNQPASPCQHFLNTLFQQCYSLKASKTCQNSTSQNHEKSLNFGRAREHCSSLNASKTCSEGDQDRSFWSGSRAMLFFEAFQNVLRRRIEIAHLHRAREHCSSLNASKTCSEEGSKSLIFAGLASTVHL